MAWASIDPMCCGEDELRDNPRTSSLFYLCASLSTSTAFTEGIQVMRIPQNRTGEIALGQRGKRDREGSANSSRTSLRYFSSKTSVELFVGICR